MPDIRGKFEILKEESGELEREVRERTVGYIVGALGLVAGLAWNEAIKALIEYIFPQNADTLFPKFIYAVFITFVVVFLSVYLVRLSGKKVEKK